MGFGRLPQNRLWLSDPYRPASVSQKMSLPETLGEARTGDLRARGRGPARADRGPQGEGPGTSQGARPQHRPGARLTLRMLSSVAKVLAFW